MTGIRVRFCPSPTGLPHVGMVRTALFNWAYARHTGGTFVFRIEDTDAARDSEESYQQLLDALRWLGLDWDEGVEVGGPYAPYRQSEREDIYHDVVARLREGGYLYESYVTAAELQERHRAAGRNPQLGYDNCDRDLTEEQRAQYRAEGREPVLRMRVPDEDITFTDLIRGEVTFKRGSVSDFVVVRADGSPLYTLTNPIDDALMGITHVLRGEDLLSSTPRQIVLYGALLKLGIAKVLPEFGHLPYVMGEGNKKLSKRDPESNLFNHRDRGFIPEGLINYLALLGWSIAPDRDVFSIDELIAAFDVHDVNPNPARFDLKKAEAINAEHIRMLPPDDFARRLVPYLHAGAVLPVADYDELSAAERATLDAAAPLIQTRITVLSEAVGMLGFLFADAITVEDDARKILRDDSGTVLRAALTVLRELPADRFTREDIEGALRPVLVDGLGIKPKFAFGPVRVAITGRRVSPPLFESMEILGKDRGVQRVEELAVALG